MERVWHEVLIRSLLIWFRHVEEHQGARTCPKTDFPGRRHIAARSGAGLGIWRGEAIDRGPYACPIADIVSMAGSIASVIEAVFGGADVPEIVLTSPTAPGVTHRWTNLWAMRCHRPASGPAFITGSRRRSDRTWVAGSVNMLFITRCNLPRWQMPAKRPLRPGSMIEARPPRFARDKVAEVIKGSRPRSNGGPPGSLAEIARTIDRLPVSPQERT